MDAIPSSAGPLAVATGLDAGTILAAGAYGTALLFFVYGGYVLQRAQNREQSRNVRWYLGIGAVVALSMIGFDAFKQYLRSERGERTAPDVFLTFSPRFSAVGLPDPAVEYRGQTLKLSAPIRVSDQSSINISVDAIIEKVKGLQQNNQQLQSALGSAALASQPKELAERIAAADSAGQDPCASGGDATLCGWKQLSNGELDSAEATLSEAVKSAPSGDRGAKSAALSGLGEIYVGQGRVDEAKVLLRRAADLGNEGAKKRLQTLAVPVRDVAPAPGAVLRPDAVRERPLRETRLQPQR